MNFILKKKTISEIVREYLKESDLADVVLSDLEKKNWCHKKFKAGRIKLLNYYQLCQKPKWATFIVQGNWLHDADIRMPAYYQINPFDEALVFIPRQKSIQVFRYVPIPFKQRYIHLEKRHFLKTNFYHYHVFKVENGISTRAENYQAIENATEIFAISRNSFKQDKNKPRFSIVLRYHE